MGGCKAGGISGSLCPGLGDAFVEPARIVAVARDALLNGFLDSQLPLRVRIDRCWGRTLRLRWLLGRRGLGVGQVHGILHDTNQHRGGQAEGDRVQAGSGHWGVRLDRHDWWSESWQFIRLQSLQRSGGPVAVQSSKRQRMVLSRLISRVARLELSRLRAA